MKYRLKSGKKLKESSKRIKMSKYHKAGTGKTSLVKSLAYEFQLDIYLINVNDEEINDDSIITILNSLGGSNNKILLFEDIDSAFKGKEEIAQEARMSYRNVKETKVDEDVDEKESKKLMKKKEEQEIKKKSLTYSGLLNALDGVLSNQNGVITIMTTNYIEKLGNAFLRPGRIDCKFELKECNKEQISMMLHSFIEKRMSIKIKGKRGKKYAKKELNAKIEELSSKLCDRNEMSKIKPCQMQHYILKYIENIDGIFENYREISQMY